MASKSMNFYSNVDHMQMLQALLKMYNMNSTDISAIRTIGFNIHVLTNINDTVLFKANSSIQESNVVTARKYSSLLKHAAEVGVTPSYAVPSSTQVNFLIREEDFLAKASKAGDVRTYIISKDNTVSIGNFIYSLDYDIEIRLEVGVNNEVFLTARYVLGDEVNVVSDLVNLTIPCTRILEEDKWVYYVYLTLKQYVREPKEVEFSNRDYQLFPISLQRPTDEIAGIDVFYRNTASFGLIKNKKLKQKIYFENSRTSEDSIFIHWDSVNTFTLVHKSQESGFRPMIGDKLRVYVYVTAGVRANFQYAQLEGPNIKFNQKDSGELRVTVKLNDKGISYGGESTDKGVEKLRRTIIAKKSTYDAIVIENDLTMQLNTRKSGNEYAVIKYRNDIQKIFNIFTTLRFQSDGQSRLVPTNTLTLDWKYKDQSIDIMNDGQFYGMTHKVVKSVSATKGTIEDDSVVTSSTLTDILYWNPFIVTYDKTYNMIRLYEPDINKRFYTSYSLLNSKIPFSWVCNWVEFNKKDYDKPFHVNFQLRHNLVDQVPNETLFIVPDPNNPKVIQDTGFVKVYFILKNKKDEEVFRARCKMDAYDNDTQDDYFTYSLEIIPPNKKTQIQNDKILLHNNTTNRDVWVDVEDLKGSIEVEMPTKKDAVSGLLEHEREVVNKFDFDCWLTKNRTKDHKIQHSVIDNDTIRLYQYPLVEYGFYKNFKNIYKEALEGEYNLDKFLDKFQGEFSYSIKFANTYGLSQNYTIGLDKKVLNNVMLNMGFIVELALGSTVTERQLNSTVYTYLSSVNFLNYDEFHISNLQKYLKDSFPNDITYIQFKGMNGYPATDQLISMNISALDNKTIIEKLSLPLVYYEDTETFGYKVTWEFR